MSKVSLKPSPYQLDALREYLGIGVGQAAATLNTLVGKHIELRVPKIELLAPEEARQFFDKEKERNSYVTLGFQGNVNGNASVSFDISSANRLVQLLLPNEPETSAEMDAMAESALIEVGNIIINSVMGTLSNCFSFNLTYFVPRYHERFSDISLGEGSESETALLIGETFLSVEEAQIEGRIVIMFLLEDLAALLDTWKEPDESKAV